MKIVFSKKPDITFRIPKDPRERAVWLRCWIDSLFTVHGSVTDQAAKAMPKFNFDKTYAELVAVKAELLKLITPEKWEKEDESGKS